MQWGTRMAHGAQGWAGWAKAGVRGGQGGCIQSSEAGPLALKNRIFRARAPPQRKFLASAASARAKKKCRFTCTYAHFIKKMTQRNPTPTNSQLQKDHGAERTLLWPIARRAWRYSKALRDVQVGNRRENTFALQARLPRAPCDAYAQKRKWVSLYMHARAAHTVCTKCARGVRALCGIGVPASPAS